MSPYGDISPSPIRTLAKIDWNFPERVAHSGIEGIHPYPAKFIAELPRALLDALPIAPGAAVLDLFCGSGTTLVECQRRGLPSVGIDINPIACLIARVKTASRPSGLREAAAVVADRALRRPAAAIPEIPNLDHWFDDPIQRALSALTEAVHEADAVHRDALRLAFSSIVVRVSRQESDTRYAAIDKNVSANDVFTLFLRAAVRLDDVLAERNYPLSQTEVFEADSLEFNSDSIGDGAIGMVVTSPPYPNAYEYWLYHKYRMYWLGFDPLAVKAREIGARAHFFKHNCHTEEDFGRQMTKAFQLIWRVLNPGGYACFIVGRSRIHGRVVDNARIIEETAAGFDLVFSAERTLSASRKSFNLSHANIKTETVLVLKRKETACA